MRHTFTLCYAPSMLTPINRSLGCLSGTRSNTTSFLRGTSVPRTYTVRESTSGGRGFSTLSAFVPKYPPKKESIPSVCAQLMSTLCAEAPSCVTLFCPDRWHFCIFSRAVSGMAFARYLWAIAITGGRVTLPAQKLWYSTLQRLVWYSQGHACLYAPSAVMAMYLQVPTNKKSRRRLTIFNNLASW